jgi:hypothetical protein
VNTTKIVRHTPRAAWLAAGGWVLVATACGNESVNVLAPRDASVEVEAKDDAADVSVDALPDVSREASVEVNVDVFVDMGSIDTSMDLAIEAGPADVAVDPPGPRDGGPTGCRSPGETCTFAGACCTLSCSQVGAPRDPRTCAAGPICVVAGDDCLDNEDCCSNRCEGRRCLGVSPDACWPAGELCTATSDCCGGICAAADAGAHRCKRLSGCRVVGEMCGTRSDCCSGRCELDDRGQVHVCIQAPQCGPAGRMCFAQMGDRCRSTADCCGGECSVGDDGVDRCAPLPTSTCGAPCAICAGDPDCCSKSCIVDESGYKLCL